MTMTTLHVTSLTLHTKCIYIIPFLIVTALPSNNLCKHSQTDIFENTKHRKINIILTFQSKYSFKYKQFQTYTQYYRFLVTLRYITIYFLSNIVVKLFIEFQEILNLKKRCHRFHSYLSRRRRRRPRCGYSHGTCHSYTVQERIPSRHTVIRRRRSAPCPPRTHLLLSPSGRF